MNARVLFTIFGGLAFCGCGSIVHTPARTSVEIALAKRAEAVRLAESSRPEPRLTSYRSGNVPAVEPQLPANDRIEAGAESYTHGVEALKAGRVDEAIKSLAEATQLDPGFTEAWEHLAVAYEKAGQNVKAMDAYAKSKSVAQH